MTAEDFYVSLCQSGIDVSVSVTGLHYRGPQNSITPALLTSLKECKAELIALLTPDETLPDEIHIPRECPNTVGSIRTCIDAQRRSEVRDR